MKGNKVPLQWKSELRTFLPVFCVGIKITKAINFLAPYVVINELFIQLQDQMQSFCNCELKQIHNKFYWNDFNGL